jgi:elongation factor Ts
VLVEVDCETDFVARTEEFHEGKPENVQEKIVEGRLKKWLEDVVLLDQRHVNEERHGGKTIGELRTDIAASTGENVVIRRFARFQVGEE